jgi:perosamine synthetase
VNRLTSSKLAIHGGEKVRGHPMPIWPAYGKEEIEVADQVLRSGHLARQSGTWVQRFEKEYARKFGIKHAIAVSSGTAAIHVALAALGVGPGDDVIHTAHCFIGTATPTLHAGAVPIFADIDERTFNISPASIEQQITPHTKAIVPVHLNGLPADMDSILRIAREHKLFVVEDAAQAHGSEFGGKLAGTMGVFGCFSFWEDKLITTAGEGGMIVTNDDDLALQARKIHHHGEVRRDGDYYQGERLYYHDTLGYNYRMTEIQGAIGCVQLQRLDEYVRQRRQNAHRLTGLLSEVPGVIPPYEPENCKHVFYKYVVRLDRRATQASSKEVVEALSAEGIPVSRRYPTPLHQQPLFTERHGQGNTSAPFCWYKGDLKYGGGLPKAERLPNDLVRLPLTPNLSNDDLVDIARGVSKVMGFFCAKHPL